MIYGIGVDMVSVARMKGVLSRWGERFVRRVFTDAEAETCLKRKAPHFPFALRFAAKEAFSKALGLGMRMGVRWRDIEVFHYPGGRPGLRLQGRSSEAYLRGGKVKNIIERALRDGIKAKEDFVKENISRVILLAEKIASAFTADRKLLLCGNGGSAADAQHIAAEFVNRFMLERPPLPAIALTTDTSVITSIGNDYAFEEVFTKQVKAIGVKGDILLAITTSGNSANIISAAKAARRQGMYTAALTGGNGGRLAEFADLMLAVKGNSTPRIQETHIFVGHLICQLVDHILFQKGSKEES